MARPPTRRSRALARLAPIVERCDPWALEDVEAEMNRALRFNGSVKSAISAALHDLAGKRLGVPLYKMWGLDPAKAPLSSFTIGIAATDDELRERVAQASEYPVLKVKLGTDHDAQIIRTVREAAPTKVLRVDANAAWTPKQALAHDRRSRRVRRRVRRAAACRRTTSTACASFANARRFRSLPTSRVSCRRTSRARWRASTGSTSSSRSAADFVRRCE